MSFASYLMQIHANSYSVFSLIYLNSTNIVGVIWENLTVAYVSL